MALTRPVLYSVTPYPCTESHEFQFNSVGGNQVVKNNLVIVKNSDNTEVYNKTIDSFIFKHQLIENTLQNNIEYKVKVRTGDAGGNWSDFSDWIIFRCLSYPVLTISTIVNSQVNNQTVDFIGGYSQAENEPLQSYRFLLYDENKILLQSFPEQYDISNIHQQIAGLENKVKKYLQFKVYTLHGMEHSTELIEFTPVYIQPRLATVLKLENQEDRGSVKITGNVIQIIGKVGSGEINYELNDRVNLKKGMIYFDEGFSIDKDFVLQIWLEDLPMDESNFLTIYEKYGKMRLNYYDSKVHVWKENYSYNTKAHYVSENFPGRKIYFDYKNKIQVLRTGKTINPISNYNFIDNTINDNQIIIYDNVIKPQYKYIDNNNFRQNVLVDKDDAMVYRYDDNMRTSYQYIYVQQINDEINIHDTLMN